MRERLARHLPAHWREAYAPGDSGLAEHASDPEARFRPQPDLTCALSVGNDGAAPAYYKRYSGGTADAGAFADLVSEAGLLGADCLAVADEGLASEGDLALLGELGLSCVVPPGRGNGFPGGGIPSGPAGRCDALAHDGRGAGRVTLPQEGLDVHVYLDTEPCHHEFSDACARVEGDSDARAARRAAEERRRSGGSGRPGDERLAALAPVDVSRALGDRRSRPLPRRRPRGLCADAPQGRGPQDPGRLAGGAGAEEGQHALREARHRPHGPIPARRAGRCANLTSERYSSRIGIYIQPTSNARSSNHSFPHH